MLENFFHGMTSFPIILTKIGVVFNSSAVSSGSCKSSSALVCTGIMVGSGSDSTTVLVSVFSASPFSMDTFVCTPEDSTELRQEV